MEKNYTCEAIILQQDGLTEVLAAQLVKLSCRFINSEIRILCNGLEANTKDMMALLTLCAQPGSKIIIKAEGAGSFEAVNIIKYFLENDVDSINEIISDHSPYPKLKMNVKNETRDFSNRNLSGVDFSGKNLLLSNFSNTSLLFSKFHESDLIGINFRNANLESADLSYADLSYADLTNANLKNANMQSTILIGATVKNANFESTNLSYAFYEYDMNYFIKDDKTIFTNKNCLPYQSVENCSNNFPKYEFDNQRILVLFSVFDEHTQNRYGWLINSPKYNDYHFSFFYCYYHSPITRNKIGWNESSYKLALMLLKIIKKIKPRILLVHLGETFADAPVEFRYALVLIRARFPYLKIAVEKPRMSFGVDMSIFDDDSEIIKLRQIL